MPENNTGIRVLLVEDHDSSAKIEMTLIRELGYECDLAPTGQGALKLFFENDYGLVLLDLQLPDMNGLDVAKEMRQGKQHAEHQAIPIVGMTGCSTEDDRLLCEKAGMNEYLAKPFRLSQLEQIIQTYC